MTAVTRRGDGHHPGTRQVLPIRALLGLRVTERGRVVYSLPMSSYEDKVWFNGDRRLDAICQEVLDAKRDQSNALILAHFKSTLARVEERLRSRSVEYRSYLPLDFSSLCFRDHEGGSTSVWVGLASYFQARSLSPVDQSRSSLRILIAEHHPMVSRDQAILNAAASLFCKAQVVFHIALTDPLLNHFGGDRIRGLMKQLGMEEQDCLSHPVISTAIRNAQEKIESQIQREMQTLSPEEWFKYNLAQGT